MSASDLLKPDPAPISSNETHEDDKEDDIEALRLAALQSMKSKKPVYELKTHPVRNNLVTIVPIGSTDGSKDAPPAQSSKSTTSTSTSNKFNRFRDKESGSEVEDESEYSEYSEYISETDEEDQRAQSQGENKEKKDTNFQSTKSVEEAEDVLTLCANDEQDEFSSFLKEIEQPAQQVKKRKKIRVVKRRKRVNAHSNARSKTDPSSVDKPSPPRKCNYHSLPHRGHRQHWSPFYDSRYPPLPSRRSRSPYGSRRSPSPYHSLNPSYRDRDDTRYYSSSYRRYSPSRRSPYEPSYPRRTVSPSFKTKRRSPASPRPGEKTKSLIMFDDTKSRSLPPKRKSRSKEKEEISSKKKFDDTNNKEKDIVSDQKLSKLPSPERQKLIARKQKFSQQELKVERKVISLKSVKDGEKTLSQTNENKREVVRGTAVDKENTSKRTVDLKKKPEEVVDLRIQLSRKRQKHQEPQKDKYFDSHEEENEIDMNEQELIQRHKQLRRQVKKLEDEMTSPTKKVPEISLKKKSLLERLGDKVLTEEEDQQEERLDQKAKTPKKKKEKKKDKKKDKKKKKKRSKRKQESSSDEEEQSPEVKKAKKPVYDEDEEELLAFFESEPPNKK